jgi:hypothetical protein
MEISIINKVMVYASEKGYTVDEKGDVYFKNKKRSLNLCRSDYYNFTVKIEVEGVLKCTRVWVHKLQAYQKFKEKMFESNIEVRHLNGNQLDNSHENISIGNHSENMLDIPKNIRLSKAIHASSFIKKHNHEEIVKLYNEGMSYGKIMKKLSIKSKGTISFIVRKSIESTKIPD